MIALNFKIEQKRRANADQAFVVHALEGLREGRICKEKNDDGSM